MVIEPKADADTEIGPTLELILKIRSAFLGAVVTVGVALQEICGDKSIGAVGNWDALKEIRKTQKPDHARVRSSIPRIQLRIGKLPAERNCMFAVDPDGVGRGHHAVLENPGEGALRSRRRTDVQACVEGAARVRWRASPSVL